MRKKRATTMAASTPNVCNAPCFVAHGTWKYATLNPPSVRARLISPEISPCIRGKQSLQYASGSSREFLSIKTRWKVGGLTDGSGVDHDSDLGDTPAHDQRADAEVHLERGTEDDEADDIEYGPDVTRPASQRPWS